MQSVVTTDKARERKRGILCYRGEGGVQTGCYKQGVQWSNEELEVYLRFTG